MSFDQNMNESVEEHFLSMFMCAHVSGLRMQLLFMRMHTYSYVCGLCSRIHVRVLLFTWMYDPTCIRM